MAVGHSQVILGDSDGDVKKEGGGKGRKDRKATYTVPGPEEKGLKDIK